MCARLYIYCFSYVLPQYSQKTYKVHSFIISTLQIKKSSLLVFFFFSLGLYPWQMEVPRLGGRIGAIAASLYHSHGNVGSKPHLQPIPHSWQRWIPNPLSEARDQLCILMDTSWICFHCATTGTHENQVLEKLNNLPRDFWLENDRAEI